MTTPDRQKLANRLAAPIGPYHIDEFERAAIVAALRSPEADELAFICPKCGVRGTTDGKASTVRGDAPEAGEAKPVAMLTADLMNRTNISAQDREILIFCDNHDTRDTLMDILTDAAMIATPVSADAGLGVSREGNLLALAATPQRKE